MNDQHEYVQIHGLEGVNYAYGAYMLAIEECGLSFKTTDIPLLDLNAMSHEWFWRDLLEAYLNSPHPIQYVVDFHVGLRLVARAVGMGRADLMVILSKFTCGSPITRQWVAAAEKLTEKLLLRRGTDRGLLGKYQRPASMDSLPEETKQLYDRYYLCRVRTGQTDHLASFGPCDEALFQFKTSEARATGQPLPTRRMSPVRAWTSERGPTGELQERSYGTDIRFTTAPADFTPEMPDMQAMPGPVVFYLDFNDGIPNKITRVSLTGWRGAYVGPDRLQGVARDRFIEDSRAVFQLGVDLVLECAYYLSERRVFQVFYWYRSRPALADPERLRSRVANHPLLLVLGAREDCPATVTAETKEQIQTMLRRY